MKVMSSFNILDYARKCFRRGQARCRRHRSDEPRSCCHPCQPLLQPPHGNLAVGRQFTVAVDVLVSFPNETVAWHGAAKPSLLAFPPIEDGIKQVLPIVFQFGEVQIQHVVELAIEIRLFRVDRAIELVPDAGRDAMCRVGGVPLKVAVPFSRIAVLEANWFFFLPPDKSRVGFDS